MSYKRIVLIALSIVVLTVTVGAAIALRTQSTPVAEWQSGFVDLYTQVHGTTDTETQSFLIEEAVLSCARLSNGYSLPEVWEVGVKDGMSSDQAATVINTAVLTTCPEMQAKLKPELTAQRDQGNSTWYPIEED